MAKEGEVMGRKLRRLRHELLGHPFRATQFGWHVGRDHDVWHLANIAWLAYIAECPCGVMERRWAAWQVHPPL